MNDETSSEKQFVLKIKNVAGPFRNIGVRMISEKPPFIFPATSLKFSLRMPDLKPLSFIISCEAGEKMYIVKADLSEIQAENAVFIELEEIPKGEEVNHIQAMWFSSEN